MIPRYLDHRLPAANTRRLVMITGARQVGKTTLARATYPGLNYISLDEIEERFRLREVPTRDWAEVVGASVLDEAQKEPTVFDKVKSAYDNEEINFSVLLGSSQILMLSRIKESLAGRVFVYELWPLLLGEITRTVTTDKYPPFFNLISSSFNADSIFQTEPSMLLGARAHHLSRWLNYVLQWGGMSGLLKLNEEERREWLHSYTLTYIEKDLSDISRIDDLALFRKFTQLAALRSGQLLSYADLARDAGISPDTARRYISYLSRSYQAFLLRPYFSNRSKSLIKSPKLYWIDVGLCREHTGNWGVISGSLLETFVVGECYRWINTLRSDAEMWFYRTRSGMEVDILITTSAGMWGIEVKTNVRADRSQASSLRRLAKLYPDKWLGGIVAYMGEQITQLDENIWAVPIGRLFG